jgi:outer membrane protein TolC
MEAVKSRPDVEAARSQARAAELTATATRLTWLPTAAGAFTYTYTDNPGFIGENEFWTLSVSANWMLWDGGMRIATQREENSKARQASLQAQKAQDSAEDSVRSAWLKLERTQAGLKAAEARVMLAEQSLELISRSEAAGGSTTLDLEQARMQLIQARIGLLSERMVRDLSAVEIRAAMGNYR